MIDVTTKTGSSELKPSKEWTIGRVLESSSAYLKEKGSPTSRLDAELLLAFALGLNRLNLYTNFDRPVSLDEREACRNLIFRRGKHEPVAYITGTKSFYEHDFYVDPSVLIPRPDTELLVETALKIAKSGIQGKTFKILDIGTGSGCIGISLALALENAQVAGWDVSESALATAKKNAEKLGAQTNMQFGLIDITEVEAWQEGAKYDLIVSNPPYISFDEFSQLEKTVVDFEPKSALFAEDEGLFFYKTIAGHAPKKLIEGGYLLFEVGASQAERITSILATNDFVNIKSYLDLGGKTRVLSAQLGGTGV